MAVNGLYIVQGELNAVVALLRRSQRHHYYGGGVSGDEEDPLVRNFADLRDVLHRVADLHDMAPNTFLAPFLDVIRSELVDGPATGAALAAVAKFLSYGLIDPNSLTATTAVENVADAVTRARFVGSSDANSGQDEVVLLKILHVLRTLMLTPVGRLLSNESVCEIMQSAFRICFESRLSELLRRAAEATLADIVQLLFTRLPTFKEDLRHPYIRRLKMRTGEQRRTKKRKGAKSSATGSDKKDGETVPQSEATTPEQPIPEGQIEKPNPSTEAPVTESQPEAQAPPTSDQTNEQQPLVQGEPDQKQPQEPSENQVDPETGASDDPKPEPEPEIRQPHTIDVHSATLGLGYASDEDSIARRLDAGGSQAMLVTSAEQYHTAGTSPDASETVNADEQSSPNDKTVSPENEISTDRAASPVQEHEQREKDDSGSPPEEPQTTQHIPYGLPCVREVFRFLISLTSPLDKQNTEPMMALGLHLITIVLEAGADHISHYSLLLPLVKDELCRSVVALTKPDRTHLMAPAVRIAFLLMESMRTHLKLQLEAYLRKLMDMLTADTNRVSPEHKEIALEALEQLWRVPGLVTELYLNYDCDLYCSNLFEDLVKMLSKNAFPSSTLGAQHVRSMDALLTVVDTIELNCLWRSAGVLPGAQGALTSSTTTMDNEPGQLPLPAVSGYTLGQQLVHSQRSDVAAGRAQVVSQSDCKASQLREHMMLLGVGGPTAMAQVRPNRMPMSSLVPSREELIERRKQKRLLSAGTDLFNQSPSKGIALLQEHGLLSTPLVPAEVVVWLKENPRLDKKKIADYIVNRRHAPVLKAFVASFQFIGVRIDDALRQFLEAFRLPGEAAEISMVMTHFSEHWHMSNGEPFSSSDSAFTLAYAVVMLNTDQHNPQVQRNQMPMTVENFKRNLRGCNGDSDFDPEMLEAIYAAIKHDEIVMPAEQTGHVRDNYLWKLLLKRGDTSDGNFVHAPNGYIDYDLFQILWGPTIAALSFVFDKSEQEPILQKSLTGFRKCASISAHYGMSDVFDNLVISLCKFSQLMQSGGGDGAVLSTAEQRYIAHSGDATRLDRCTAIAVALGESSKSQMAARALLALVHEHGDILREGWHNVLECMLTLYRAHLLPSALTEAEDYVDPKGWVSIDVQPQPRLQHRVDSGFLSSFMSYLGGTGSAPDGSRQWRQPTNEEHQCIKTAQTLVVDCHPELLVTDSKYLTKAALDEFIGAIVQCSQALLGSVDPVAATMNESTEGAVIFCLELLVSVALENKDRLPYFWDTVRRHVQSLIVDHGDLSPRAVERAVVGLLRLANRNLFRGADDTADELVQSLTILLILSMLNTTQRLPASTAWRLSRQVAYGLHELLRNNAANVHRREHWDVLFALLEAAGAGVRQMGSEVTDGDSGDSEPDRPASANEHRAKKKHRKKRAGGSPRAYTSDSELISASAGENITATSKDGSGTGPASLAGSQEWIKLDHPDATKVDSETPSNVPSLPVPSVRRFAYDRRCLVLRRGLVPLPDSVKCHVKCQMSCKVSKVMAFYRVRDCPLAEHDARAYLKCCETLAFVVRDAAHITPYNFEACVRCLCAFVEAGLDGGKYMSTETGIESSAEDVTSGTRRSAGSTAASSGAKADKKSISIHRRSRTAANQQSDTTTDETVDALQTLADSYHQTSHQLIDLCHTLHVKAAAIFSSWAEHGAQSPNGHVDASAEHLWLVCWRPLLQALARLCTDCRRYVRTQALNYLVRAFLISDLQRLSPAAWEDCFGSVLFPLLAVLADNVSPMDPLGMEETRVRAIALLSKVLLNHLGPLSALASFSSLWLTIIDFMQRYLHTDRSDLLSEAIPESLKNMLLVMDNTGMFLSIPGLYVLTEERLRCFLPDLLREVLPNPPAAPPPPIQETTAAHPAVEQSQRQLPQPTHEQPRHDAAPVDGGRHEENTCQTQPDQSSRCPAAQQQDFTLESVVISAPTVLSASPPIDPVQQMHGRGAPPRPPVQAGTYAMPMSFQAPCNPVLGGHNLLTQHVSPPSSAQPMQHQIVLHPPAPSNGSDSGQTQVKTDENGV